ncbi:MAG: glutamate--tRNA ligase [Candidatus Lokiarchaeota archaeon]|jgi:glutamyl-tRNA synthetase|nr:glutamate--tRNA ligase [Candidatus Lokiarchaeota archaeon]
MDIDEIKRLIWLYGLENAVKFEGKPNLKAIMGKLISQKPELRTQINDIKPLLDEIIVEISKLTMHDQREKLLELDPTAFEKKIITKEQKGLPKLPNAQNYEKIIMRLAPYPSGALHIGNARMVILNSEYVNQYEGRLILFFDDTIGSSKSMKNSPKAKFVLPDAYQLIEDGLKWLEVEYSKVYYKSDRLEIYYEYCEKLIQDNIAYVCFCSAIEFRENYKKKKEICPHRNQSVTTNLKEWNNMKAGKYRETEVVVRLKTGMDQKDPALRDQIIMRISEADHPRVGNKFLVWPMLEFSWAIDDHLIGATHILRGIDLVKEDLIEEFIWDHFNWKKAEFLHYGRLKFPDMKLSKTQSRNNIIQGIFEGWDDPRTWSLQSLEKRGIRAAALRKTLLDLGMSTTGIIFDESWLYSKNKDIIDGLSSRYFYVEEPINIEIENVPFSEFTAEPLLLPSNPKKGKRKIKVTTKNDKLEILIAHRDAIKLKTGQIIRLKDLLNIQITAVDLNKNVIKSSFHSSELNREFSIFQWVSKEENVQVSILKPDGTISKGNGEINLKKIPLNNTIQFERFGFVNPIKWEDKVLICYFTH